MVRPIVGLIGIRISYGYYRCKVNWLIDYIPCPALTLNSSDVKTHLNGLCTEYGEAENPNQLCEFTARFTLSGQPLKFRSKKLPALKGKLSAGKEIQVLAQVSLETSQGWTLIYFINQLCGSGARPQCSSLCEVVQLQPKLRVVYFD